MHRHKAKIGKMKIYGFAGCVNPHRCKPEAHGNIRRVDVCSCGAVRESNRNHGAIEYGPWKEE